MNRQYQETWFVVVDEKRNLLGNMSAESVDLFTNNTVGEFISEAVTRIENILRDRDWENLKVYSDISSRRSISPDTFVDGLGHLGWQPLVIVAPKRE